MIDPIRHVTGKKDFSRVYLSFEKIISFCSFYFNSMNLSSCSRWRKIFIILTLKHFWSSLFSTSRHSSSLTDCNGTKFPLVVVLEHLLLLFKFSFIGCFDRSVADVSISYVDFDLVLFVPFFVWVINPQDDDASAERVMIDVASWRKEFDGVVDCDEHVAVENEDIDDVDVPPFILWDISLRISTFGARLCWRIGI